MNYPETSGLMGLRQLTGDVKDHNRLALTIAELHTYVDADRAQRAAPASDAQPVAWLVYWGIGEMRPSFPAYGSKQEAEDVARSIKSYTQVRPLYAAAQPVAVQQVPLTPARKNAMRVEYVAAQPEDAARAYYSFIAGIEWAEREHGIKPAGEKGGA